MPGWGEKTGLVAPGADRMKNGDLEEILRVKGRFLTRKTKKWNEKVVGDAHTKQRG